MSDEEFHARLRDGVVHFSNREIDEKKWGDFVSCFSFMPADFTETASCTALAEKLAAQDQAWNKPANHIFYLATPPTMVESIVKCLGEAGLALERSRARIVTEKPFGHDLASAREGKPHADGRLR